MVSERVQADKRTSLPDQMGQWRAKDTTRVVSEAAEWSVKAVVNKVMILDL